MATKSSRRGYKRKNALAYEFYVLLLLAPWLTEAVQATGSPEEDVAADPSRPPYHGTIFIDPDIITDRDPTAFARITYIGKDTREVFDRRTDSMETVRCFLYTVHYHDGLSSEYQVNAEFGTEAKACAVAMKYAEPIGRIPAFLRKDVEHVVIHDGDKLFGGGNRGLLIHDVQGDKYIADGILEETLVHEAAHTSLDPSYTHDPAWNAAQAADGKSISVYARDFPYREDLAESVLPYLAYRFRPDRIDQKYRKTIPETIPGRIAFFDALDCKMVGNDIPRPDMNKDDVDEVQVPNPVLDVPLADPSIVIHEGRFYMYATRDPWGKDTLACKSTADFVTWEDHDLNWPTKEACKSPQSSGSKVWAPGVIQAKNGRFYMYVSVGNEIYCGVADHPAGSWKNVFEDQRPLIPKGYNSIDAEPFIDDDGKVYLYWGSGQNWANGRCFMVELESDMFTFASEPKEITPPNYIEAPFMVKRNGRYYLMYSDGKCIDESYKVRYAVADSPRGPFDMEGKNSPILVSDIEREIVGPGHHSVFQQGGKDYIAYHRHRRPFSKDTLMRQICFDRLTFDEDGAIDPVHPTEDEGVRLHRLD